MKKLLRLIVLLSSLTVHAGNDGRGGGHVIFDENGKMAALDFFMGTGEPIQPKVQKICEENKLKSLQGNQEFQQYYDEALKKFDILNQDKNLLSALLNVQQAIKEMSWYVCEHELPKIDDHRFQFKEIKATIYQFALQNKQGQVVFSGPLLSKAKDDHAQSVVIATIIHEIILKATDFGNREAIASYTRAFYNQDAEQISKLKNPAKYFDIGFNLYLKKKFEERINPKRIKVELFFEDEQSVSFMHLPNAPMLSLSRDGKLLALYGRSGAEKLFKTNRYANHYKDHEEKIKELGAIGAFYYQAEFAKSIGTFDPERAAYYAYTFNLPSRVSKLCLSNFELPSQIKLFGGEVLDPIPENLNLELSYNLGEQGSLSRFSERTERQSIPVIQETIKKKQYYTATGRACIDVSNLTL